MPTLNKLEYLDETKQEIKGALNTKFNSGITDNDTFRSYVDKIKNIYTNWPRVTGENTELSLSPTKKGLMNLNLKGNTSQDAEPTPDSPQDIHTVSGENSVSIYRNFFDISTITQNTYINANNGVTGDSNVTNLSNYIELKDTSNCYLDYEYTSLLNSSDRACCFYDDNKTFISGSLYNPVNKGHTLTTPINAKYARFSYDKNCNDIKFYQKEQTYPLSLGDLEYCKIGDYEDGFVRNSGKNLVSSKISSYAIGSNGRFASNSDYDMHIAQVIQGEIYTATTNDSQFVAGFFTELPTLNSTSYNSSRIVQNEKTFTAPITGYVAFRSLAGYTTPMLNSGTTALPYEPYGNGDWYLKKNIGKVVFNGSENWKLYLKTLYLENLGTGTPNSICSHFTNKGSGWTSSDENNRGKYTMTNQINQFKCMPSVDMTVQEFKDWLSTHNTIVYYVLETPTYILLNNTLQTQLDNIVNALSYDEQTNISQTNDDLPFIISASALMKGGN